ncbi:MAG: acyloxyacyl hydrolase [Chlamydiota bacterium]
MRRAWIAVFLLSANLAHCGAPPDFLSFGTGAFDIMREKHRTWEFEIEYKFHVKGWKSPNRYLEFRPLLGLMATAKGSFYLYLGINFDLLFWDHLLFAPGFAAGYYAAGQGKDLGFPVEFRSGVELAWQFSDWHRLGLHFYHLSNASIGKRNPGEESLVLFYDIPLVKGFPFIRDLK